MTNDELDREVDERGQRTLAAAHAARVADQPLLRQVDDVASRLAAIRSENHWAAKVREKFRESR